MSTPSTGPDEREAIEARLAEIELTQTSAAATPLIWSAAHPGDSTLSNDAYGLIQHDVPWLLSALRAARRELESDEHRFLMRVANFALTEGTKMHNARHDPAWTVLIDEEGRDVCDPTKRQAFERMFEYQDEVAAELLPSVPPILERNDRG